MRINRLLLRRFRCFSHLRLEFEPGLNLIKGPNGAGKSTVQRAIFKALFDRPTETQANLQDKAWDTEELYTLEVEIETEDQGSWTIRKDFENNRTELYTDDGQQFMTYQTIQRKLYRLLGVESDRLFASTIFVAQTELAAINDGRRDITQSLEERVAGGEHGIDTQAVLRQLERTIAEYRRGYETHSIKNPGPIARLMAKQSELTDRIGTLRRKLAQQAADWEDLERLRAQQVQIEDRLTPQRRLLEAAGEVRELQDSLQTWTAKEQALEKQLDAVTEAQADEQAAAMALHNLAAISALSEREAHRLEQLRTQIEYLQSTSVSVPSTSVVGAPAYLGPFIVLALGIFIAAAVAVFSVVSPGNLALVLAGSGVAFMLIVAAFVWFLLNRWQAGRLDQHKQEAYLLAVDQRKEEIAAAQASMQTALSHLGVANWQEYETKRDKMVAVTFKRQQAQTRLDTLLGANRTREELEQERRQASRERRDVEEKLQEPDLQRVARLTPLEYEKIAVQVQQDLEEKAQVESELDRIRYRLEDNPIDPQELLRAEERAESLARNLALCKERLAVYRRTQNALLQARQQTIGQIRKELAQATTRYFARLTSGQYDCVRIDSELQLQVARTQDSKPWIKPNELSCGTRDQLYLATRLALAELVFEGKSPPLLLDDPFVTFDAQRRTLAHRLCHEIADDRQVLLFTCSDDYDHLGHVIELDHRQMPTR